MPATELCVQGAHGMADDVRNLKELLTKRDAELDGMKVDPERPSTRHEHSQHPQLSFAKHNLRNAVVFMHLAYVRLRMRG